MIHRLQLAWHVLRGRPLIYRMHFTGGRGVEIGDQKNTIVDSCFFDGREAEHTIKPGVMEAQATPHA